MRWTRALVGTFQCVLIASFPELLKMMKQLIHHYVSHKLIMARNITNPILVVKCFFYSFSGGQSQDNECELIMQIKWLLWIVLTEGRHFGASQAAGHCCAVITSNGFGQWVLSKLLTKKEKQGHNFFIASRKFIYSKHILNTWLQKEGHQVNHYIIFTALYHKASSTVGII